MSIRDKRKDFTESNARLKRARRLYMRLVYRAVLADETSKTLRKVAKRAQEYGLYSLKSGREDIHTWMLSEVWKLDTNQPSYVTYEHHDSFKEWLRKHGWSYWRLERRNKKGELV